jgi:hypothetical protein
MHAARPKTKEKNKIGKINKKRKSDKIQSPLKTMA